MQRRADMVNASLVTSFVLIKVYNGSVLLYPGTGKEEDEEEEEEEKEEKTKNKKTPLRLKEFRDLIY